MNISIIPISSPTLGGSEWRHPADTTPCGPRLSLITTVSHYPPCGGCRGRGDHKHHLSTMDRSPTKGTLRGLNPSQLLCSCCHAQQMSRRVSGRLQIYAPHRSVSSLSICKTTYVCCFFFFFFLRLSSEHVY